ncbi:MAG: hypothetical protein ABSF27_07665 [Candidatus Dormibacteria bacterium]
MAILDAKAGQAGMERVVKRAVKDRVLRPHAFVGRKLTELELDGAHFEVYVTRTGKLAVWCNHPPRRDGGPGVR